jgi:hypothetical protein
MTQRGHSPGRTIGRNGSPARHSNTFLSYVLGFGARQLGLFIAGAWTARMLNYSPGKTIGRNGRPAGVFARRASYGLGFGAR